MSYFRKRGVKALVAPSIVLSMARRSAALSAGASHSVMGITNNIHHSSCTNLGFNHKNCKVGEIRVQLKRRGYVVKGKDKSKARLLKELQELTRAESLSLYTETASGGSQSTVQRWSPDAGFVDRATLARGRSGNALCRYCGLECPTSRRTFCSDACVHEHRIRTQGSYVRKCLLVRDGGQCGKCGLDAAALARRARAAWMGTKGVVSRRQAVAEAMEGTPFEGKVPRKGASKRPTSGMFWHADHIVPVSRGGGICGLDNYRTLCVPCHAAETKHLASQRAVERASKSERSQEEACGIVSSTRLLGDDNKTLSGWSGPQGGADTREKPQDLLQGDAGEVEARAVRCPETSSPNEMTRGATRARANICVGDVLPEGDKAGLNGSELKAGHGHRQHVDVPTGQGIHDDSNLHRTDGMHEAHVASRW